MKLQLELTDLKNVEEPQSEDLRPLVCIEKLWFLLFYIIYLWPINVLAFNKPECLSWHSAVNALSQEEDLQEIIAKISSKRVEHDEARAQMAELKSAFEKAEQEYKQHKQLINTAAEEADVKKVETTLTPLWLADFLNLNTFLPDLAWCFTSRLSCNILWL